ncbi:hypothetical protein [Chitinophaga vietnamensis]|uniref:hypothetical protein n=1 Tax=Chitinophaga vietnamensis TaxID=2593957 RepID=UPI0011781FAA|nr:hypothetical protein [Chitinophaga vietnamensis]
MKKVLLMMLLMGGAVLTTYAQRGYDRGWHGRGNGWGHYKHGDYDDDDRWERRRCERERYRDWDDCERPRRVVYYRRPYYAPVVPVPVPVPGPVYYPSRPRVAFHAGVSIVN